MPESPVRRSALAEVYRTGTFGAAGPGGPGVRIAERWPLTLIHLAGNADDQAFSEAVAKALGVVLPRTPHSVTGADGITVLALAPRRWLAVTATRAPDEMEAALRAALTSGQGAVTDVSNGRTVFRIEGAAARDLVAKGCPIDVHRSRFGTRSCAQSRIGHLAVLLHAVGADRLDVYVARGFAVSLWEWLTEAAAEIGYRVDEAGPD